jgi:hypothetical protein
MSAPKLGYEDDIKLPKSEIGRVQLERAINLFLDGDYLCAITLAGAAEAIYAGILEDEGLSSAVEDSVSAIQVIRESTSLFPMGGKPNNQLFNGWNAARNDLKHHGKGKASIVSINLFDEAFWMVKRALENARKLDITIVNSQDFENWVIMNINL